MMTLPIEKQKCIVERLETLLPMCENLIYFTYCKHRDGFKFPNQKHHLINEFFKLLQQPNMATTIIVKNVFPYHN